jgi:formylglycine-generating enzyme required for sulfatase activity
MFLRATLIAFALCLLTLPAHAATLKGLWEFSNSANIGQGSTLPGGGTSPTLTVEGTAPTHLATLADDGSTSLSGVIRTAGGTANRLRLAHGIAPNGGTYVNNFTLMFDVFTPSASRSSWRCFYQTNTGNSNDGEYFIRNSDDKLGTAALVYSSAALPETVWKRVVISVNLGTSIKTYVDGVLWATHTSDIAVDGHNSLDPQLLLFADNSNENQSLNVGAVAIWDGALSAAEAAALSVAGSPVIPTNFAPVITEGAAYQLPQATLNGPAVTGTLNATDADGNPVTWSVITPAGNGTANIPSSTSAQATITYAPTPGFSGLDSFVVQATDGTASDTITVSVLVVDPNALPYPTPNGLWEFDQDVEPTLATIGTDLATIGSGFSAQAGTGTGDRAQQVTVGSSYIVTHGIPAGTGGGTKVNEWTVLYDVNYPASGTWKTLLQTTPVNNDDGELFIRDSDGAIGGVAAIGGYSSNTTSANSWYRVIITAKNGTDRRIYVNGALWYDGNSGALDDRLSLAPTFLAFADEDGEDGTIKCTNLAVWSKVLTPAEIAALGSTGARIVNTPPPTPNFPPVITEGTTVTLSANMNTATVTTFNATDGDNDVLAWTISSPAGHGTAQVTSSSAIQATVTYTPTTGYTGADTFTLRAADEKTADTIVVNLNVQNGAPVITEGETYTLSAVKNDGARTVTFHATDPNSNPLTWNISSAASHGAASITASSATQCTVSYTPTTDYSGFDEFTVTTSDGVATDSIVVSVSVTDPTANPTLTIVSAFGTPNPPVGTASHPRGTALTNSVADVPGATTRRVCTGWSMIGDGPHTGTANTMNMTLTRDSVLTWQWKTEHRVETSVVGTGTISVNSGWYEAGKPLQISATPGAGQYFVGWSGDTAGCSIGGKNIVLPMNRPYATITATFALNDRFTVVGLPDTQNYTSISSPTDTYTKQTQWCLDNKAAYNIRFVTHLGDIVNSPTAQSQWQRATDAMNRLNNQLAYGTCPGNHDLASGDTNYLIRFGPNPTHSSSVGRWVNPSTTQNYEWYRGASPRGYSSYQIVTVNGKDYMFLHLDMDTPDQDLTWAASVLAAHPRTLTMVTTHNYLAETGADSIYGSGTGQRGRTKSANISIGPDRNSPLEVFNSVIKPFNQVYMVICGHNFAQYNIQATNNAGNPVHEVLCDYQSLPNGGNGFLRIMEFKPGENKIDSSTYSPSLGRYITTSAADQQGMLDLTDPLGGQFTINFDFEHRFDSTLTVVSPQTTVSPAIGTHEIMDSTPFVATATDQIVGGTTRYRATGYNITGAQTASGTGNSATLTMNGDATLSWNWATEYRLDTSANGQGIVSVNSGWQAAGVTVDIQAQPDPGASFLGWSGDIAGCTINGTTISVPMTRARGPVTAGFTPLNPTFNVNVVSAYNSVSPAPATYTYEQGTEVTFTAEDLVEGGTRRVCTGYNITGAVTQSGSGRSVTLPITGNTTITWNWQTQYRLQTLANGPGSISGGAEQWITAGADTSITATPNVGASFTGWTGDTTAGTPTGHVFAITGMSRPVGPLTASFMTGVYTLTVVSPQSTTTPTVGTHQFPYGTVVNFSSLPNVTGRSRQVSTGWVLSGATTGNGSTREGTVTMTGDTTLTWTWAPEFFLEITDGVEGAVLPTTATGWKASGAEVTLQAAPASWFQFVRWNGDVPGNPTTPTVQITMDQARTVAADFTAFKTTRGTPHWWLSRHATVQSANYEAADMADSDNDGELAHEEFKAGMSDLDAKEVFRLGAPLPVVNGTQLEFTWPAREHRRYQLLTATTLGSAFVPLGSELVSTPPQQTLRLPFPAGEPRRFYEISVTTTPAGLLDADSVAASNAPRPGSLVREMKLIPGGSFTRGDDALGSPTAKPEHTAIVSRFFIDKYEVTRADWETVATWSQANGYDIPITLEYTTPLNHPIIAVSWHDAAKWCNARSEMEGRVPAYYTDTTAGTVYRTGQVDLVSANVNWAGNGYRLPTEAEWERASRGGLTNALYSWGNEDSLFRANHWDYQVEVGRAPAQPYPYTERVGYFDGTSPGGAPDMANGYGLYDMAGNAWEWCWDRMSPYSADTQIHPRGPDTGDTRVQRGGGWWNYIPQATNSQRLPFPPDGDDDYGMNGFRCLRAAHPNE